MANRTAAHGLTAECNAKIKGKYDIELEREAREWIEQVTGLQLQPATLGDQEFCEALKDGSALCALINALQPGSVKKVNTGKMAFKLMENIGNFLSACDAYGCNKNDMFQTVDLYEGQNMTQVVNGIHALGRKAQAKGYNGPTLGVKEATEAKREFTEEQLAAGKNVIGLQMGSNKGATQAGQSFGKSRHIID